MGAAVKGGIAHLEHVVKNYPHNWEQIVSAKAEEHDGVIAKNIVDVGTIDTNDVPTSTDYVAFKRHFNAQEKSAKASEEAAGNPGESSPIADREMVAKGELVVKRGGEGFSASVMTESQRREAVKNEHAPHLPHAQGGRWSGARASRCIWRTVSLCCMRCSMAKSEGKKGFTGMFH